jgi:hypothetical protein
MNSSFLPIEKQAGTWRVKWVSLVGWVLFINLSMMLIIYLVSQRPLLPLRHPVTVKESTVLLYTQANTGATSHVESSATQGDALEIHSLEPNGWCYVTHPASGLSGYVRQAALLIPDSTREAARIGQLSKQPNRP